MGGDASPAASGPERSGYPGTFWQLLVCFQQRWWSIACIAVWSKSFRRHVVGFHAGIATACQYAAGGDAAAGPGWRFSRHAESRRNVSAVPAAAQCEFGQHGILDLAHRLAWVCVEQPVQHDAVCLDGSAATIATTGTGCIWTTDDGCAILRPTGTTASATATARSIRTVSVVDDAERIWTVAATTVRAAKYPALDAVRQHVVAVQLPYRNSVQFEACCVMSRLWW